MSFSLANQEIGMYSQYSPLITNTSRIEKKKCLLISAFQPIIKELPTHMWRAAITRKTHPEWNAPSIIFPLCVRAKLKGIDSFNKATSAILHVLYTTSSFASFTASDILHLSQVHPFFKSTWTISHNVFKQEHCTKEQSQGKEAQHPNGSAAPTYAMFLTKF